jgi:hypothetical protein
MSPTFVFDFASGGHVQYSVTPITLSPRPRSKIISVAAGASDSIRCGAAAKARRFAGCCLRKCGRVFYPHFLFSLFFLRLLYFFV